MGDMVAYIRVSTQRQGQSGLGLEAQQASVEDYARRGGHSILAIFREIESGKRADRPELTRALAYAKRARAVLIIAKLDRLARNVAFLANLLESGAEFLACDNPTANRLTIHILAAVAEDEARRISERTKAALAAYKARGGQVGTPGNLKAAAGLQGAEATKCQARAADAAVAPTLRRLREGGASLRRMADELNAAGHATRTGLPWNATQVRRVLTRNSTSLEHQSDSR